MTRTRGNVERVDEPTVIEIIQDTHRLVRESVESQAREDLRSAERELEKERTAAAAHVERLKELDSAVRHLRWVLAALVAIGAVVLAVVLWIWLDTAVKRTFVVVGLILVLAAAVAIAFNRARAAAFVGTIGLLLGIGDVVYHLVESQSHPHHPSKPPSAKPNQTNPTSN